MICKWQCSNFFFRPWPCAPHHGQPPCRGGGALYRWPERFLKSGGEELTKTKPVRADLLHVTSAFVLISASQPTTALQPSTYDFTAVYSFTASTCNLVVTFGDAHWAEMIRPQRWAGPTPRQGKARVSQMMHHWTCWQPVIIHCVRWSCTMLSETTLLTWDLHSSRIR